MKIQTINKVTRQENHISANTDGITIPVNNTLPPQGVDEYTLTIYQPRTD